ncbi:tRNA uridine-5-carboxymethylaminomethyl(34) synthesis GTPase MnmE [bacterium]|nr:tRNA uridine-5-carboxymethylaminomethyl(34) synthesis GTPase MnmE [bacterium]NBV97009.1 tRNA uridine-5-carboxymethylaminomethyl(34) synthesis GTPase MnmE [Verrucomicrobiota bacterium]
MAFEKDTITACATPPGVSALAMIRISGPQAIPIAAKLAASPPKPRSPVAVKVHHNQAILDEVVMTSWPNPKSYTGEDLVEISCHGNPLIVESILQAVCSLGARPARPGEFTERAFLNGRIDLTRAEAILDVLHARSERALLAGQRALAGKLSARLMADRESILQLLARIEAWIDFPEEDIQPEVGEGFRLEISNLLKSSAALLATAPLGQRLRSGYRLVLSGPPNAGKSTLLNALLGMDRALVSPVPGTTRDTVEESIVLNGFPVRLIDTAGLRSSTDPVEIEGISRTRAALESADLILALIDSTQPDDPCAKEWSRYGTKVIPVLTKGDLPRSNNLPGLTVSAQTGLGLDSLKEKIAQHLKGDLHAPGADEIAVNARHEDALRRVTEALACASASLCNRAAPELVASDLRLALQALESILGVGTSEDVLDRLFAQFCIGK